MTAAVVPPSLPLLNVLRLVADGYPTPEIATLLRIPEATVKSRMHLMRRRYGVSQATELVMLACRNGWLPGRTPHRRDLRAVVVADPAAVAAARGLLLSLHTVHTVDLIDLSSKDRSA